MSREQLKEREDVVLWRTLEGVSARTLAASLGVSERSIVRIRARLRSRGRLSAGELYDPTPG